MRPEGPIGYMLKSNKHSKLRQAPHEFSYPVPSFRTPQLGYANPLREAAISRNRGTDQDDSLSGQNATRECSDKSSTGLQE